MCHVLNHDIQTPMLPPPTSPAPMVESRGGALSQPGTGAASAGDQRRWQQKVLAIEVLVNTMNLYEKPDYPDCIAIKNSFIVLFLARSQ